jgi:hypothetical protein
MPLPDGCSSMQMINPGSRSTSLIITSPAVSSLCSRIDVAGGNDVRFALDKASEE